MDSLAAFETAAGPAADLARSIVQVGTALYLIWAAWSLLAVFETLAAGARIDWTDTGMALMRILVAASVAAFVFS